MATDATGTPTVPDSIPTLNTAVDAPSGNGFNAAMAAIQTIITQLKAGTLASGKIAIAALAGYPADATKVLKGDGTWAASAGSDGWNSLSALTYGTTDGHTFTATYTGDLTTTVPVGSRVKLTNQAATQYFIVTAHVAGTLTLYGGTTYSITATAITNPFFSREKSPVGFPLDPTVWTESLKDTVDRTQATAAVGTWYNLGTLSLAIPIGAWSVEYEVVVEPSIAATQYATLSTANNTESDVDFSARMYAGAGATAGWDMHVYRRKHLLLAAKTSYFLNSKTTSASTPSITFAGSASPTFIRAICAYL